MHWCLIPCETCCLDSSLASCPIILRSPNGICFGLASWRRSSRPRLSLSSPHNSLFLKHSRALSSSKGDSLGDLSISKKPKDGIVLENDELGLLNKPSPVCTNISSDIEEETDAKEQVLGSFLKFLKPAIEPVEGDEVSGPLSEEKNEAVGDDKGNAKIIVDYYEPKPGDFVVGVVVSGNENKIDVNVGANILGTMLTKEILPLYDKEMDNLLFDLEKDDTISLVPGKMGILRNDALNSVPGRGKPLVDVGSVLFAEVLGRTLSGRPLLSTRRLFRRVAWHRVRQIKEMNEPFEVQITEWNTGGLLARIEGLRAFIPKAELVSKVNSFNDLKENVGRRLCVLVNRINELNNDLILSEKEAWEMINLQEGKLLDGTVKKIFAFGAQIRINDTNRSGLLHISRISKTRIGSVHDVLKVDDNVKVLVVKSMFPDKIALSIADLEGEPGVFLSDRERFFADVEKMANIYKQNLQPLESREAVSSPSKGFSVSKEADIYANWKWFKFKRGEDVAVTSITNPFVS